MNKDITKWLDDVHDKLTAAKQKQIGEYQHPSKIGDPTKEPKVARAVAKDQVMDNWQPEETAPKGVPVIVSGGIAMKKTGGKWFTGMEEPLFQRPIQWEVKGWMPIPIMQSPDVNKGGG